MTYGFSTGALALGELARGLDLVRGAELKAVELSALRERELEPFLRSLATLDLSGFEFVSVHAPSRFAGYETEALAAERLLEVLPDDWPVVLHPDASRDLSLWSRFGERLLVENMDKRKRTGRSAEELSDVFDRLPQARLCFDIAHARQVDPSMLEAWRILDRFGGRVGQVHISELNTASSHCRISNAAIRAFGQVARLIPPQTPIILESLMTAVENLREEIPTEVERARRALEPAAATRVA